MILLISHKKIIILLIVKKLIYFNLDLVNILIVYYVMIY